MSLVLHERRDGIAWLTLNNPERRNALSRAMLQSLRDTLRPLNTDRTVRVAILRAAGPVFSAGHDLSEMVGRKERDYAEIFGLCTEVMETIRLLRQPVIAQVQGVATAAGCQLAASCDLVIASENAAFATPGVKIGLFCTTPAVALCRAVTTKKAMEMLLTGNPITALEAERAGLVNKIVPAAALESETMKLAAQIASFSSEVIALGKRAFYEQLPLDRPQAYELAQSVVVRNAQLEDAQEGFQAFLEKRAPKWRGPASVGA